MKRSFKLFSLIVILLLMVSPALAANTFTGTPLSLPGGVTAGYLMSMWGAGASDIHAIGYSNNGSNDLPLTYHYDGSTWTSNSPALPGGLTSGTLRGSWGSGPNDVHAVGFSYNGSVYAPLMYHYNGTSWANVALTVPGGWTNSYLYGAWGFGANDVYAVGYGYDGTEYTPLVYHYDGVSWTNATPSLPGGWTYGGLFNVWGTSSSDLYASAQGSGGIALYHYNGSTWSDSALANPAGWSYTYLWDFWGSASNNIYVFGGGTESTIEKPLIYHYDGSTWTDSSPALPSGWNYGYLYSGWGTSASDIYAVGYGYDALWNAMPLVYHFDGSTWTALSLALPGGFSQGELRDTWGLAMNNLFAVGNGYNGSTWVPLVYHGVDVTPPVVTVPSDITAEATSPAGAAVSFFTSATDDTIPANPVVTCSPASGATFPLGTTNVDCWATDNAGNTGHSYFNINVVDTTPPTLNISDVNVPQSIPGGAVVNYAASATDLVDGPVAINCVPASGSTFPIGTTTVYCSATDSHSNTANGSFDVTVAGENLLKKPDFASASIFPNPWKAFGFRPPYSAALDCSYYAASPCSVIFSAGNRAAFQQVNRTGLAGDTYSFGMSSAAQNAGGVYRVELLFYNNFNKLLGSTYLNFSPGTHNFELVSGPATAPVSYNKIIFRFVYNNPSGRAWFDDAFLYFLGP